MLTIAARVLAPLRSYGYRGYSRIGVGADSHWRQHQTSNPRNPRDP
jgi:hypothetical protein